MAITFIFFYAIFGCSLVMGKAIVNRECLSEGEMVLQFPKKIEQGNRIEKFVMVLNATILKGETLTMTLPSGDGKTDCVTKLYFAEADDSSVLVNIGPNDVNFANSNSYKLFRTTTLEIFIEEFHEELLMIYVQGQDEYKQPVDSCNITNIRNINYISLKSGISHLNSIRFEFENNL